MTPTLKAKLREELGSLTSDAKLARVYRAVLEGIREPETVDTMARGMWTYIDDHRALGESAPYYTLESSHKADLRAYAAAMIDALLSQGEAVE